MATRHTRTATGHTERKAPAPVRLRVIDGPDAGREAVLEAGTAVLGTRDDCALVLTDGTVSRRHTSVQLLGGRVRVSDLGSRNGTRYHGAKVTQLDVPVGAALTLGKTVVAVLPALAEGLPLSEHTSLGPLLGRSVAMRRLFAAVERVAPTDATVLVLGETGSGKEGVARALHQLSPRAKRPWQVLDCGALAATLLPSALFGHVKGAFTGATRDQKGALEAADGGTLFLDEVGELSLEVQATFLRALETRRFTRVGDTDERGADFRLVAATHRPLEALAKQGRFRADLFHRLGAVTLNVPPLRDRSEDVPLLAQAFAKELGKPLTLGPAAMASLAAYRWPGNVRELRNVVERALTLGEGAAVPGAGEASAAPAGYHEAREQVLKAFERAYLVEMLERAGGSAPKAAKAAGLARSYFYRMLEAHGLKGGADR